MKFTAPQRNALELLLGGPLRESNQTSDRYRTVYWQIGKNLEAKGLASSHFAPGGRIYDLTDEGRTELADLNARAS